jgi:hypothetical protein
MAAPPRSPLLQWLSEVFNRGFWVSVGMTLLVLVLAAGFGFVQGWLRTH